MYNESRANNGKILKTSEWKHLEISEIGKFTIPIYTMLLQLLFYCDCCIICHVLVIKLLSHINNTNVLTNSNGTKFYWCYYWSTFKYLLQSGMKDASAKSLQSCLTLCSPADCSPPGSSVHGILQARILEWVTCPPPRDLPNPEIEPTSLMSPALAGRFLTLLTPEKPIWYHKRLIILMCFFNLFYKIIA